jgi:hypothetical protein
LELKDLRPETGYVILSEHGVASWPGGLMEVVIHIAEGPYAGLWLGTYSMDEDSTDTSQSLKWRPAKKIVVEEYEETDDHSFVKCERCGAYLTPGTKCGVGYWCRREANA